MIADYLRCARAMMSPVRGQRVVVMNNFFVDALIVVALVLALAVIGQSITAIISHYSWQDQQQAYEHRIRTLAIRAAQSDALDADLSDARSYNRSLELTIRSYKRSVRERDALIAIQEALIAMLQVSVIEQKIHTLAPGTPRAPEIARAIRSAQEETGVEHDQLLAIAFVESSFRPKVESHAGARGLMQVMPLWYDECGADDQTILELDVNAYCGAYVMRHYLERYGSEEEALAAYNGVRESPEPRKRYLNKYYTTLAMLGGGG